ncbi:hypothetical protein [Halopseudomonas salina]|uniref:Uncharacterized protein n=1 Tax=Halopseudomonas salina TaxID=1323744 RepID=A0ABQ1NWW9_9GAMM|nr:hypothetical protein [Halopseudomonas salina]GGC86712.1 hypothetical protein GCM10007418_03110 [Halopseudomonas salina]
MKFQNIVYTTALTIAMGAGSGVAVAGNHADAQEHGKNHAEANDTMTNENAKNNNLNTNDVEAMREEANDEALPNSGNRAVPGAPKAGKNPAIDSEAGEHDLVD